MRVDELRSSATDYARQRDELIAATGMDVDDECLIDTLQGITNLDELIVRAAREAKYAEAMAEAVKAIISENQERRQRLSDKADKIRAAIARAMQDAGLPKIIAPDLTLSISRRKPAPKVVDVDALPAWAMKMVTTSAIDRDAIKEAFEEDPQGFSCPGCVVTNGEPVLRIGGK